MSVQPLKAFLGYEFRLRAKKTPLSIEDYRQTARRALPEMAWRWLADGADDEVALRRNRTAFENWTLRQSVLSGTAVNNLRVKVGGTELALPIALTPAGLNGLCHWQGELGAARAAERAGTRHTSATGSSYTIEEIAAGTKEDHWFQLYPYGDRELIGKLVKRAQNAGMSALFVTVDVPVVGNREGAVRAGMALRPVLTPRRLLNGALHPRWSYGYVRHQRFVGRNLLVDPNLQGAKGAITAGRAQQSMFKPELLSWDTVAWLRELWTGPLYIKGVTEPDDAARCIEIGADGVVVSNHGGRQLDATRATIDALPGVVDAVAGRGIVLIDSGFRRGSDVIKAMCLGATACLIGRAFLYGLATSGEAGVYDVLRILRTEIETNMALMGVSNVADLDRSWIAPTSPVGASQVPVSDRE